MVNNDSSTREQRRWLHGVRHTVTGIGMLIALVTYTGAFAIIVRSSSRSLLGIDFRPILLHPDNPASVTLVLSLLFLGILLQIMLWNRQDNLSVTLYLLGVSAYMLCVPVGGLSQALFGWVRIATVYFMLPTIVVSLVALVAIALDVIRMVIAELRA